jgi:hypothetical protein
MDFLKIKAHLNGKVNGFMKEISLRENFRDRVF